MGKALLLVTDFLARLDCVMTMEVGLLTSEEEETLLLWSWHLFLGLEYKQINSISCGTTAIITHFIYYLKEGACGPDLISWKVTQNSAEVTTNWDHTKQVQFLFLLTAHFFPEKTDYHHCLLSSSWVFSGHISSDFLTIPHMTYLSLCDTVLTCVFHNH